MRRIQIDIYGEGDCSGQVDVAAQWIRAAFEAAGAAPAEYSVSHFECDDDREIGRVIPFRRRANSVGVLG